MILVGRTGVDGALRADPALELVRVGTAMEAIGELGDPIDHDSPASSVVIVGPDAEPDASRARAFVDALRLVDERVRVFRVVGVGATPAPGVFDGVVDAALTSAGLRARLQTPSAEPVADRPRAPEPMIEVAAAMASAAEEAKPAGAWVGDEAMVAALLRGEDPASAGCRLIGRRTGSADVAWSKTPKAGAEDAVPVRWRGRTLGYLSVRGIGAREVQRHATWLAGWIRLREQRAELEEAAFTDALTGAWNRRYFERFLSSAIERTRRVRGSLTVMVFDIDNFKRYNDDYGHPAGDEILVGVVDLLRAMIRPTDRVCRIGGDEFAVVFHEPAGPRDPTSRPPETVFEIAKRFQKAVCEQKFPSIGEDAPGSLTVSGGLATYPWDGATADDLVRRADDLAMQSKRDGKNAIALGRGTDGEPREA